MFSDKYTELLRQIETEEKEADRKQRWADNARQHAAVARRKDWAKIHSTASVFDEDAEKARQRLNIAKEQMESLLTQSFEDDAYVGATLRYGYNEARIRTFEKYLQEKTISFNNVGKYVPQKKKRLFAREEPDQEEKFEAEREKYRKEIGDLNFKLEYLRKQQKELKAFIDASAAEYERKRREAEEAAKNSPEAQTKMQEEEKRQFESFGGASWY